MSYELNSNDPYSLFSFDVSIWSVSSTSSVSANSSGSIGGFGLLRNISPFFFALTTSWCKVKLGKEMVIV